METIAATTERVMSSLTMTKDSKPVRTCYVCQKEFESYRVSLDPTCADCFEKLELERETRRTREREQGLRNQWRVFCPRMFQETDISKLPCPVSHDRAMQWRFSERGMVLHGKTGTGKSRTAWKIIEREFFNGKKVSVINASSAIRYAAMFSSSSQKALDWIDDCSAIDLMLMDDAFKVKLTDSYEAALFAILDGRMERMLPTIATTNDTGESMQARMSQDRGDAFIRRLKESCESVGFRV